MAEFYVFHPHSSSNLVFKSTHYSMEISTVDNRKKVDIANEFLLLEEM